MKYLILPDIHNRWEIAEKIIKSVKPDKTIFLGDYFDDFGDNPHIIADVADWFHHSVNQKDRIHLCGNHDLHYWFKDNKDMPCSGYEQFKSITINDFVTKQDWEKLKFFYILDNKWLLSHAGVHPSWVESAKFRKNPIVESSLEIIKGKLAYESTKARENSTQVEYTGLLYRDLAGPDFPIMVVLHGVIGVRNLLQLLVFTK